MCERRNQPPDRLCAVEQIDWPAQWQPEALNRVRRMGSWGCGGRWRYKLRKGRRDVRDTDARPGRRG